MLVIEMMPAERGDALLLEYGGNGNGAPSHYAQERFATLANDERLEVRIGEPSRLELETS